MEKLIIADIKEILDIIDEVGKQLEIGDIQKTTPVVVRVWKGVISSHFSLLQDLRNLYDAYKDIPDAELEVGEELNKRISAFTTEILQFIEMLKMIE